MIDCSRMKLSINQIYNLRHAVGLDLTQLRKGQRKYEAYRNYFVCCGRDDSWDELCFYGLAEWFGCDELQQIIYKVTAKGVKVLEYLFAISIEMR